MKKKGSKSDTQNHRNRAILKIFQDKKRDCKYESFFAICVAISKMPTHRYYISEAMGVSIWGRWRKTGEIPAAGKYKGRLYEAFIKECERIQQEEGGTPLAVVRAALECKAPCMGVSPFRIFVILKQMGQK